MYTPPPSCGPPPDVEIVTRLLLARGWGQTLATGMALSVVVVELVELASSLPEAMEVASEAMEA